MVEFIQPSSSEVNNDNKKNEMQRFFFLYGEAVDVADPRIFRESLSAEQQDTFDMFDESGQIHVAALGLLKEDDREQLRKLLRTSASLNPLLHGIGNSFQLYDMVKDWRLRRN